MRIKVWMAPVFLLALAAQEMNPTCIRCPATYIPEGEMQAYLTRVQREVAVSDQQVRAVNVGKSNVDLGVVYRGKLSGPPRVRNTAA